jgi:Fe2+ transport system protein B
MVAEYEVKYIKVDVMSEQETRTLFPSESEDGILLIEDFPGAADNGMSLEARIKYTDGVFSSWVSSKDPTIDDTTADNPDGLLVPVVIGILLAVVVLVVVIFFIVKRRKSQTKYDPELAQNDDETKQLKESNPEA